VIRWTVAIAVWGGEEGEHGYDQLALGDEACAAEGDGQALMIQRAYEFDEQDVRYGMDTYCLVDERATTHYGGVSSWSLDGDVLQLRLDAGAAAVFDADGFLLSLAAGVNRELVASKLALLLGR
jgi:Immunity protein 10